MLPWRTAIFESELCIWLTLLTAQPSVLKLDRLQRCVGIETACCTATTFAQQPLQPQECN